jgi:hypothetical protein
MIRLREEPPRIGATLIPGDPDGRCEVDALRIGGIYSPGFCVIGSGAEIIYMWDKRKAYGYGGAWLVFTGDDLPAFDVTWKFFTERQKAAWDAWFKPLRRPPAKPQAPGGTFTPLAPQPPAHGVYNPILADQGIDKIVLGKVGPLTQPSIGLWTRKVTFIKWQPPVPLIGKPDAAVPDVAQKTIPAKTKEELELEAAQETYKRKAAFVANGYHGKGVGKATPPSATP